MPNRIIDSHQHFWIYDEMRDSWITPDMQVIRRDFTPGDFLKAANEQVTGTVAVQADESDSETIFLLDLAERHDFIKGVVGWIDLKDPAVDLKLQTYTARKKLRGFRNIIQGRPDDLYFTNKDFRRGFGLLSQYRFTYDLLVYHDQLPAAIRFTEQFPDQPMMLDHLGKPAVRHREYRKWKENIRILARHPGINCKISGLVTEADWQNWRYEDLSPYLETVAEYFGTDRLCFGSDWPVCLLASSYSDILEITGKFLDQVSTAEQEKIWSGNAIGFYKLS